MLQEQAEALTQRFINELKPQLKRAMNDGGAATAIGTWSRVWVSM